MKTLGLKYGDVVKVEGTGRWDGVWQIQDTMNQRFAGQKKIDFLVPEDVKLGKWNTVKLYSLSDRTNADIYMPQPYRQRTCQYISKQKTPYSLSEFQQFPYHQAVIQVSFQKRPHNMQMRDLPRESERQRQRRCR